MLLRVRAVHVHVHVCARARARGWRCGLCAAPFFFSVLLLVLLLLLAATALLPLPFSRPSCTSYQVSFCPKEGHPSNYYSAGGGAKGGPRAQRVQPRQVHSRASRIATAGYTLATPYPITHPPWNPPPGHRQHHGHPPEHHRSDTRIHRSIAILPLLLLSHPHARPPTIHSRHPQPCQARHPRHHPRR